jgi:hypothetical protein
MNNVSFNEEIRQKSLERALKINQEFPRKAPSRDEKRNLRFPCIQWKRKRNFVPISTVYKGNANFVFRPWLQGSGNL